MHIGGIIKMSAERMDFKEFTDVIRENIRDYLPDSYRDAEIKVEEFHKLDHSYMGMQVKREGQTVVPNINLDAHYSTFMRNGQSLAGMDAVLQSISQEVQSQLLFDTEWLQDYSQVKDKLYIRVSDAQENAYILSNSPHKEVDGLAVSYHIAFENGHGIEASTTVTNNLLKMYEITEEQLHNDAMASSQQLLPVHLVSLAEMMGQMMGMDADMVRPTMDEPQLMVLTNEQALHGAGVLFYPDMMDTIADYFGSDYFVLPSSIHEVLLLPDDGTVDPDVLENMVQDVNMAAVAPEERLSDHAYHYDAKDHVLEKVETYGARMEMKEMEAEKAARESASKESVEDASKAEELHGSEPAAAKVQEAAETDSGRSEKHREAPGKERRSVLARLNDKKEEVRAQPKKNTPVHAKAEEL